MSMLTPPGMGGKYRVTGTQYPRMRRPRRRGRVLAAVIAAVVALGVIAWGTQQLIDVFGGDGGSGKTTAAQKPTSCRRVGPSPAAAATPSAPTGPLKPPKPGAVTINVYNATTKSGLAKKTADQLAARGFKIGTFGNADPTYDQKVAQTALLLVGPDGQAAARAVSAQLPGVSVIKTDPKAKGVTVDLMIGKAFTRLNGAAAVKKALAALAHPSPSPSPSATGRC